LCYKNSNFKISRR